MGPVLMELCANRQLHADMIAASTLYSNKLSVVLQFSLSDYPTYGFRMRTSSFTVYSSPTLETCFCRIKMLGFGSCSKVNGSIESEN